MYLLVSVQIQLAAGVSPHRVCVSGAQTALWRAPGGRCKSAEGSPCDVLVSVCVVCRLERFARYLGRREGKDGGETWKQKALLIGSLSSSVHRGGGGETRLFPPLPEGVIVLIILANQNTANEKTLMIYACAVSPFCRLNCWLGKRKS